MENNQEVSENVEGKDLLADEIYTQDNFAYASQGQRFLNWLIDNIAIRFTLNYLVGEGLGYLLGSLFPDFFMELAYSDYAYAIVFVIAFIIVYLCYILYYTLCEKLFKGYTLGKIITGTRAIRQDGGELTFRNALLRSLSRCVPFEVFSGFSTLTWHDRWTGTMVIKAR